MSRSPISRVLAALALAISIAQTARAALTVPSIFSDHMVLQADSDLPVWGRADAGSDITVTLADQSLTATTDASGKWNVTLGPIHASAKPIEMTIAGGGSKVTIKDILVGEVWIGSGQSNMGLTVARAADADKYIQSADHPQMRLFTVGRHPTSRPAQDPDGKWVLCSPKTVGPFSAVLYQFGRNLHEELKVPVGLINSSWGGTPLRSWMPREAFTREEFDAAREKAETSARAKAKAATHPSPDTPTTGPTQNDPTALYNGMIAPLIPYAIRGATWYQGEANVGDENYARQMASMVRIWRAKWSQGDFPFLYVQIAPYAKYKNTPDALPEMWEMQTQALKLIPNSGLAPIGDLGNLQDIHPKNKHEVGRRLALIALARTYNKPNIIDQGPMYESHSIEGNKLRIRFTGAGSGLVTRDGAEPKLFEIAGADGKFAPATAKIEGNEIVLSSESVPAPTAARFAWSATAEPNLTNKEGLPAVAFRTNPSAK